MSGTVDAADVRVHPQQCIGSRWCAQLVPDAFAIGTDGKVQLRTAEGVFDGDAMEEAVDTCPVGAIEVEEP